MDITLDYFNPYNYDKTNSMQGCYPWTNYLLPKYKEAIQNLKSVNPNMMLDIGSYKNSLLFAFKVKNFQFKRRVANY